ncbi:hypothetical protein BJY59DRAFT_382118 [Rhodotorula toruloides]
MSTQEAKDGPPNLSAAYQPTTASSTGNFEANSSVHGGQISLKTGQRSGRPIATNRRVSGKARPAAIQPPPPMPLPLPTPPQGLMADPTLPVPPNSAGMQMGQLPSPLSGGGGGGYLDPSPISPHGPRGSYPPRSGGAGGSYSLQQQQQQDYAEMMQRADMLQLQQRQGGGQGGSGAQGGGGGYDYDLYSTRPLSPDSAFATPAFLDDGPFACVAVLPLARLARSSSASAAAATRRRPPFTPPPTLVLPLPLRPSHSSSHAASPSLSRPSLRLRRAAAAVRLLRPVRSAELHAPPRSEHDGPAERRRVADAASSFAAAGGGECAGNAGWG